MPAMLLDCGVDPANLLHAATAPASEQNCSLLDAISGGQRPDFDGPFQVGCPVTWLEGDQVCSALKQFGRVMFLGDSFTRHQAQTFWMLVRDDFVHGALQHWQPLANQGGCRCDFQYNDGRSQCREHSMAYFPGPGGIFCKSWKSKTHVTFHEMYGPESFHAPTVRAAFNDSTYNRTADVAKMGPLHYLLDYERIRQDWGEPFMREVELAPLPVTVIFLTMHRPQVEKKPLQYRDSQGPAAVAAYNDKLRAWAAGYNATVFDTYTITTNATSYDGTHFGLAVNTVISQLLLNTIAQMTGVAL